MRPLQHHHPRVGEYRNRAYSGDSQVAAVSFRMLYSVIHQIEQSLRQLRAIFQLELSAATVWAIFAAWRKRDGRLSTLSLLVFWAKLLITNGTWE